MYDVKYNITSSRRMDIVKAFNANDLHTEIVIKGIVDDPLFRASDVGVVLDIASIRSVLRDFDESEKVVHTMHTLGGTQEVTFLTEKGLYKVLKPSQLKSNTNKE